jgi:hypothetical protein
MREMSMNTRDRSRQGRQARKTLTLVGGIVELGMDWKAGIGLGLWGITR